MRYLISLLFTGILLASCGTARHGQVSKKDQTILDKATKVIAQVRKKHQLDKRTSVFDLVPTIENGQLIISGESNQTRALETAKLDFISNGLNPTYAIETLPAEALKGYHYGVVRLSVANLRSKPKVSSGLETQALMGMPLKVLKQSDNWYLVQTPEQYTKWMNGGAFTLMDEAGFVNWQESTKLIFVRGLGYAYESPDSRSRKVTDLLAGAIFRKVNQDGDFTKIGLPDGKEAFVLTKFVTDYDTWLESRQLTGENIIQSAYNYLGAPYVWGGTSAKGLDCSGFTKNVFFQNGIMLPRDASQQVTVGREVELDADFSKLQAGDLLFFGRKATASQKEKITHVAIYIGDGRFIHAGSTKAQVAIESLRKGDPDFTDVRLSTLVKAKRIIGYGPEQGIHTVQETMR